MRYVLLCLCNVLLWSHARSQLSVGTAEQMVIQNGTIFFADSLVLIPSADITVSNTDLTKDYNSVSGPSGSLSIARVYNFSNPFPIYNGTAGIIYSDAELAGNTEGLLQIAYRTDDTWTISTTSTVDPVANFVSYDASGQIYQQFTATQAGAVLPVSFSGFSVSLQNARVQLNWSMGDINGLLNFDVQFSNDGRNWSSAGLVEAPPNTRHFSFDHHDLNFTQRVYRIQANETGGLRKYSKLAIVQKTESNNSMSLIRRGNGAVLFFNGAIPSTIQVFDVNGRLLITRNVQQQQVEISGLASGAYIIHYIIDGKRTTKMVHF